jgi:hypothetical protein
MTTATATPSCRVTRSNLDTPAGIDRPGRRPSCPTGPSQCCHVEGLAGGGAYPLASAFHEVADGFGLGVKVPS